jgi:hypothetical protein
MVSRIISKLPFNVVEKKVANVDMDKTLKGQKTWMN